MANSNISKKGILHKKKKPIGATVFNLKKILIEQSY